MKPDRPGFFISEFGLSNEGWPSPCGPGYALQSFCGQKEFPLLSLTGYLDTKIISK
jgi:hypothetical protein